MGSHYEIRVSHGFCLPRQAKLVVRISTFDFQLFSEIVGADAARRDIEVDEIRGRRFPCSACKVLETPFLYQMGGHMPQSTSKRNLGMLVVDFVEIETLSNIGAP